MNHVVGNAIEIFAEIPSAKVSGTTLTLESLIDPDGNELAASESLTFDETVTNQASVVWQSTYGTNPVGKYTFIIKAVNGTRENFARGTFFLVNR